MPLHKGALVEAALNTKKCDVKIFVNTKVNEYRLVLISGALRVAKLVQSSEKTAQVRLYFRNNELPYAISKYKTADGKSIKMHDQEVIEDAHGQVQTVHINQIVSKCSVINADPSDFHAATLKQHKETRENGDIYICRYKLIKQTTYVLMPVSWKADGIDERRELPRNKTLKNTQQLDEQSEYESDDPLADHHYEYIDNADRLVSPFKIIGNSVQKMKRSSPQKNDENDISPSKRSKRNIETNGNYLVESTPKSIKKPHTEQLKANVRKNLNTSFTNLTANDSDLNDSSVPGTHYEATLNDGLRMKLKITETKKSDETPTRQLRKATQTEKIRDAALGHSDRRKSILRTPNSSNQTPKKNVRIVGGNENENKTTNFSTPTSRCSGRKSAMEARNRICIINAYSPEEFDTKNTTKSTPSKNKSVTTDVPSTPKSKSKAMSIPSTPKSRSNEVSTPRSTKQRLAILKTPSKLELTPQSARKLFRSGNLTPSLQSRLSAVNENQTELQLIRERLHVSAVPQSLPCRETEFDNIYTFVRDKIVDGCGGCIYIAGVPGTGKTATVTQVVKTLQFEVQKRRLPKFEYVDINGMRLTEPHQAYVQIYRQLTGTTMPWAQARDLLEKRFTKPQKNNGKTKDITTILLIDELDIICNRKQDVVYNLFDWTSKKDSKLVAITIANTMDLPERVLKLKVSSRLGLTRITFQPYAFKQLQAVVMARLAGSKSFISDAVQLVARKVASVSGDCRRALDICRRATEIAEETTGDADATVKFVHVQQALEEMFASPKVRAIRNCSKMEKLFLRSVAAEVIRTGIEEVEFIRVYTQLESLAPLMGISRPPIINQALNISLRLGASRILIVEDSTADIFQKIILNVSVDDLHFALNE